MPEYKLWTDQKSKDELELEERYLLEDYGTLVEIAKEEDEDYVPTSEDEVVQGVDFANFLMRYDQEIQQVYHNKFEKIKEYHTKYVPNFTEGAYAQFYKQKYKDPITGPFYKFYNSKIFYEIKKDISANVTSNTYLYENDYIELLFGVIFTSFFYRCHQTYEPSMKKLVSYIIEYIKKCDISAELKRYILNNFNSEKLIHYHSNFIFNPEQMEKSILDH